MHLFIRYLKLNSQTKNQYEGKGISIQHDCNIEIKGTPILEYVGRDTTTKKLSTRKRNHSWIYIRVHTYSVYFL